MKFRFFWVLAALCTVWAGTAYGDNPPGETSTIMIEPTFIELNEMTLAGIAVFAAPGSNRFAELWGSFPDTVEKSEGLKTGTYAYGLELFPATFQKKKLFSYMAACEVSDSRKLPVYLMTRTLPACHYAVFPVPGGLKGLGATFEFIYQQWLPKSVYEMAHPFDMERYDVSLQSQMEGEMSIEILVPVQEKKAPKEQK